MGLLAEIKSLPQEEALELAVAALETIMAGDAVQVAETVQMFGITKQEARLLIHLAAVHPRISPTESIIAAVWGFDDASGLDSLRHIVKRLRLTLGKDAMSVTYGVGYRLSDEMAALVPKRKEMTVPSFPRIPEGEWRGNEPWTKDENTRLSELLALGVCHHALAKMFGRTKEAIDHKSKQMRAGKE